MPVLGSKLRPPRPRRRLVQRARLTDRIRADGGERPRLVLVAAPAGFGKTTLLAQWLAGAENSQRRVAWLTLDAGDADFRVFVSHLVAAIQTIEPEAAVDALARLEAGATAPPDAVLVSLINDLDVLAGPTVVALDDYHVIDAAAVHDAVTFLLDNLPPQVTLALTTRADPPLPLSRLRARGELVELRAADLRFTTDEAEVFLNEVMELHLDPALVAALEARTEGWAASFSWPRFRPGPMPAGPTRARVRPTRLRGATQRARARGAAPFGDRAQRAGDLATAVRLDEHAAHAHQAHLCQARREHPPLRRTSSRGAGPPLSVTARESSPQITSLGDVPSPRRFLGS